MLHADTSFFLKSNFFDRMQSIDAWQPSILHLHCMKRMILIFPWIDHGLGKIPCHCNSNSKETKIRIHQLPKVSTSKVQIRKEAEFDTADLLGNRQPPRFTSLIFCRNLHSKLQLMISQPSTEYPRSNTRRSSQRHSCQVLLAVDRSGWRLQMQLRGTMGARQW